MNARPFAAALTLAALVSACGDTEAGPGARGAGSGAAEASVMEVAGAFRTPESVLHDTAADVYLVSNISGSPLDADGNGFISRVSPSGDVIQARWIDGARGEVTLNAPKGMAIRGDTLYVADIDCVRMFVRGSGAAAGEVCFPEATFLNDVAVDHNGTLYVTDTGLEAGASGFQPSASAAVYRFSPDGRRAALAQGDRLGNPNGIAFGPRGGFVVTFGTGEIYQLQPDGSTRTVLPGAEGRQLDGIAFTADGGFLFSSWGDQAVTLVGPDGAARRVLENVEAPADIGYDARRNRVLVPLFNGDRVLIKELGSPPATGAAGRGS